jgi:NAD(P)-dependent dehydrogenase (short-subunit alcohol dehydrogenase family)
VTGAFGALGRTVAGLALEAGAKVALLDKVATSAGKLPDSPVGRSIQFGGIDLTDSASVDGALTEVSRRLGTLDVLINIAGGFRWEKVSDGSADTWSDLFSVNLLSAVNCCRAALPDLRRSQRGRIINVGANAAMKAGAGMGAYAASKAGVHKLTESLADELKESSITVNAVLPSILDTPANRKDMPDSDYSKWVKPDALAKVILFLASDDAAAITGALIPVTGRV